MRWILFLGINFWFLFSFTGCSCECQGCCEINDQQVCEDPVYMKREDCDALSEISASSDSLTEHSCYHRCVQ